MMGFRVVLKACPRCRGDLFLEKPETPEEARELPVYSCLQCGRKWNRTASVNAITPMAARVGAMAGQVSAA